MIRGAGQLVSAGKLFQLAACAANDSKYFSVERNFENSPGVSKFSNEKHLVGAGCDADRIGSANHRGEALAAWGVSVNRMSSGGRWHVDGEHTQNFSIRIEHLDTPIGAIADVEVVVAVRHNSMREAELSRRSSLFAPGLHPIAILVEFRDARVDISVRNVDVAVGVPRYVGGLAEHSVYRRKRRVGVLRGFGPLIGRFRPASEDPYYPACLIELDNHVGALVDGPDIVVLVDSYGVGLGPGVEAFPDFAYELAFGTEFEQLRRRAAIGRTVGAVRTREHEDVALGINGHARNLAKIHARRQRGKIRNGIELNFGHILLSVRRQSEQH